MDAKTFEIAIVCILASALFWFFFVFRGKGEFEFDAKKGKLKAKGENPPPPTTVPSGVKVSGEAGRNVIAHSASAGGVEVDAKAKSGDIRATHEPGQPPPKT